METFDTSMDGFSDGTDGQVICASNVPNATIPNPDRWIASYTAGNISSIACKVTCNDAATGGCSGGGGGSACSKALIYYFDAKR